MIRPARVEALDRIEAASAELAERWRERLGRGTLSTFVILGADAALVGFVSVGESRDEDARPGDGELYAIYVEQNARARRFYERHGWTIDRADPDRYDWAPSVRYRKAFA